MSRILSRLPAGLIGPAVLAGLAFLPVLLVHPGIVTSDTKTYLYLDPFRFLSHSAFMWDPTVGLGTVTHEYLGYLFPMGPFFAGGALAHIPLWAVQRLWLGTILFAAGAGILYLSAALDLPRSGALVGGLAYMLSPYALQYAGRISVILLPWAGLPWLLALAIRSVHRGGWRHPAAFAIVTAAVSGINASSILYVGLAPVLWLLYSSIAERAELRRILAVTCRIGLLTFLACLWWIAGLGVEAAYGVDVLRYTETVPATSETSTSSEVLRGLGYWYFYGADAFGPWTAASVSYTQDVALIAASYALPLMAFVSALVTRWRHRAYFGILLLVGVVLSVGAHPYTDPTPVGGALKAFMVETTAGLAMRSTDRATPLVILSLAMLLAAGVAGIATRLPLRAFGVLRSAGAVGRRRIVAAWGGAAVTALVIAVAGSLVIAANPALFDGHAESASFFVQPSSLPAPEMAAIAHLNATHPATRVLAVPGNDFASYRWGDTVDTPQPAFLTRPFVTREQQVLGSIPTADTLYALDSPIQTSIEDWTGLAPMARLLSAGDVMVEGDQAYEHYGVPQPTILEDELRGRHGGLSDPVRFGHPLPNDSSDSTLNEQDLATTGSSLAPVAPVETYTVTSPRALVRAESTTGALVVAGDATGLGQLADAGVLGTNSAIYYAGTLASDPGRLRAMADTGATLVVTDTNRKQGFRWDTLTGNSGETETPTVTLTANDPSDSPIELFAGAGKALDQRTYAIDHGAQSVTASSYGNSVSFTPEDRPYAAVDGNADTSWETGIFLPDPAGQWWQLNLAHPERASAVTLTQPLRGTVRRWITRVTLTFDGGSPLTVNLGPSSRRPGGQRIDFPHHSFRHLRVTIDATSDDSAPGSAASAVGFSTIALPGLRVREVIQTPTGLLSELGGASAKDRLLFSFSRERVSPYPPRTDPETSLARRFTLPTARSFSLAGTATMSTLIPDDEVDRLVGEPGATGSGTVAYSEGRLPGGLRSTAAAAADGVATTVWTPGLGGTHQLGEWLEYNLPTPMTVSSMNLSVVADGRHSVPTRVEVSTASVTGTLTGSVTLALPAIADAPVPGATTTIPLQFPAMTGSRIRVTIRGVRLESSSNYYSSSSIALPLGIATVGIPGLSTAPIPSTLPGTCQSNLVWIDKRPIPVEVVGSTATALANGSVGVEPCGWAAAGIGLSAGPHILRSAVAHQPSTVSCESTANCSGWNLDNVLLDSAPGGSAAPAAPFGSIPAPIPGATPSATVVANHIDGETLRITGASAPFELVLGQSLNPGWTASIDGHSLGAPSLVDAFANGWHVVPPAGAFTVVLTWTPQSEVWAALAISGGSLGLCLLLCALPARGRAWLRRLLRVAARPRPPISAGPSPRFAFPWSQFASRPPLWLLVGAAALVGFASAALAPHGWGAGVGLGCALGVAAGGWSGRIRPALVGLVVLVVAVVRIAHGQQVHPVLESAAWPAAYESEASLVWLSVLLVSADAVSCLLRWRRTDA